MFAAHESAAFVIDVLRAYLSNILPSASPCTGFSWTFWGLGVMISGESGPGQKRAGSGAGFRAVTGMVADDAVDLYRISQTTIEGRVPGLLQNLLEVRGIGLLDIKAILVKPPCLRRMRLKMIVHLVRKGNHGADYDRMPMSRCTSRYWAFLVPQGGHSGGGWPQHCGADGKPPCATRFYGLRGVDVTGIYQRHRRAWMPVAIDPGFAGAGNFP